MDQQPRPLPGKRVAELVRAAEGQFRLEEPASGGKSIGAHYRQLARSKRVNPDVFLEETLGIQPIPSLFWHVWEIFAELSLSRQSGFGGPQPIQYSEIVAWATLHRRPLLVWEVDVIKSIDVVFLQYLAEREKKRLEPQSPPRSPPPGGRSTRRRR